VIPARKLGGFEGREYQTFIVMTFSKPQQNLLWMPNKRDTKEKHRFGVHINLHLLLHYAFMIFTRPHINT
jgi:hypothetical protein